MNYQVSDTSIDTIENFFGGERVANTSERSQEIYNPATGAVTGRVTMSSIKDR